MIPICSHCVEKKLPLIYFTTMFVFSHSDQIVGTTRSSNATPGCAFRMHWDVTAFETARAEVTNWTTAVNNKLLTWSERVCVSMTTLRPGTNKGMRLFFQQTLRMKPYMFCSQRTPKEPKRSSDTIRIEIWTSKCANVQFRSGWAVKARVMTPVRLYKRSLQLRSEVLTLIGSGFLPTVKNQTGWTPKKIFAISQEPDFRFWWHFLNI